MSVYLVKKKGWRYDFTLEGTRHTEAWYKTKREAKKAEAEKRKEVLNPVVQEKTPIDMDFLELCNRRMDYLKLYCSNSHCQDSFYCMKRWCSMWGKFFCKNISTEMVESYFYQRKQTVSAITVNKELRLLRSLFNFGMKDNKNWLSYNPVNGIGFFPVDKKEKYVPSKEDVLRVIAVADSEIQDYLFTMICTMGRMGEINSLTWEDVHLKQGYISLYTRKKRGGHRTPRRIPLNERLTETLSRRYEERDKSKPWVFWHRYWSKKTGQYVEGPYRDRKRIMRSLCNKAGVKYFRYHALRHFAASMLDHEKVSIGDVQRLLGHQNRLTTEIYLHSVGDGERAAVNCLNI